MKFVIYKRGLYNESLFILSYVEAADVTDKTQFVISPILFKPLELSEIWIP